MSTIDDPYDSDDPLAPKLERLIPVTIPKYRENTPPVATSSNRNRKKVGPSPGDAVLLGYLAPNRPDLAREGGDTVLLRDSPPHSRSRSKSHEEPDGEEDLDEKIAKQIMKEEEEAKQRREQQRASTTSLRALNFDLNQHGKGPWSPSSLEQESEDKGKAMTASKRLNDTLDPPEKVAFKLPLKEEDVTSEGDMPDQLRNGQHKAPPVPSRLNIRDINNEWNQSARAAFPPPMTAVLPSKQAHFKREPRRHSINSFTGPPNDGADSPLASSPLRTHLKDPPTSGIRLAPMNSSVGSPPSKIGIPSPILKQQLPPLSNVLKNVEEQNYSEMQTRTRQRQQSMSSISAMTAPSPTFTLSSGPSPATYGSPSTSLDSATSPRDWVTKVPGSTVTSPCFPQFDICRRPSHPSETFPVLQSAAGDGYRLAPDAFSADAQGSRSMPGEINGRLGETMAVGMGPPTPLSTNMSHTAAVSSPHSATAAGAGIGGGSGSDMANGSMLQSPLGPQSISTLPHGVGTFKCNYPDCNAAPFHTQYLLNSHTTVHSSNRPHYCPVAGCSRSVTGQGFKRKNEMIRHQLVHESPGYVCPFCPEREHKYPRPDNLQRHVRVHHADVQPGDHRLRQVLERKASGRGTGRRRKGVPY